jgi:hypothetical protein
VALPLAFAATRWLRQRPVDHASAWRLVAVAAGLAAALLLLLGPAASSLRSVLAQKVGSTPLPGSERWQALALLFPGTASVPLALTFWLLAGLGIAVVWRRQRPVAVYALLLAGGHVSVVLLAKPYASDSPVVFVRYLLPILPWVLLAAAQGLVALGGSARPRRALAAAVVIASLGALAVAGPLGDPALRRSSFLHSATFLLFPCPRPEMPPAGVPAIYRTIAAAPGTGAVVEAPGAALGTNGALRIYQEIHRRPVRVAAERMLHDRRMGLRNTVRVLPASLRQSTADWILVHRDLGAEEARVSSPVCFGIHRPRRPPAGSPDGGELGRGDAAARRLEAQLTAAFGPPDSADDGIAAWDLARVRRSSKPTVERTKANGGPRRRGNGR